MLDFFRKLFNSQSRAFLLRQHALQIVANKRWENQKLWDSELCKKYDSLATSRARDGYFSAPIDIDDTEYFEYGEPGYNWASKNGFRLTSGWSQNHNERGWGGAWHLPVLRWN